MNIISSSVRKITNQNRPSLTRVAWLIGHLPIRPWPAFDRPSNPRAGCGGEPGPRPCRTDVTPACAATPGVYRAFTGPLPGGSGRAACLVSRNPTGLMRNACRSGGTAEEPHRGCDSGNPAAGGVGLADLPDEAPAQRVEVTKQGVDRVNRGAARPPGGCLVPRGAPVCPLHQRRAEDASTVSQASRGVAHGASGCFHLRLAVPSVSRDVPAAVGGHARKVDKSFVHVEHARRRQIWAAARCPLDT